MPIKISTYLICFLLFTSVKGFAQLSMPYSLSPIASSNNISTSNGGSPIVLANTEKCLNVSSGLAVVTTSFNGKGVFGASCEEKAPVAVVEVRIDAMNLFPNPANVSTTLKCDGTFDKDLFAKVSVVDFNGNVVMMKMVPMKEIKAGYKMNVAHLVAGVYVVNMSFNAQQHSLKMIKM